VAARRKQAGCFIKDFRSVATVAGILEFTMRIWVY